MMQMQFFGTRKFLSLGLVGAIVVAAVGIYAFRHESGAAPPASLILDPPDKTRFPQSPELFIALSDSLVRDEIFRQELTTLQQNKLVEQTSVILTSYLHDDLDAYVQLMADWGGVLDPQLRRPILDKIWPDEGQHFQIVEVGVSDASIRRPEWIVRNGVRGLLHHGAVGPMGAVAQSVFHFPDVGNEDFFDDSLLCLTMPMTTLGGSEKTVTFWFHWSEQAQRWLPVQTVEQCSGDVYLPRMIF